MGLVVWGWWCGVGGVSVTGGLCVFGGVRLVVCGWWCGCDVGSVGVVVCVGLVVWE